MQLPMRIAPRPGAVLLADCSISMVMTDGGGSKRRIDRLAELIAYILMRTRLQALVCFNDRPTEIPLEGHLLLPEPAGTTALERALDHVRTIVPRPRSVIVVSDGQPNSETQALDAARALQPLPIDAYYCGAEGDQAALAFMERLATLNGGRWGQFSLAEPLLLGEEIRRQISYRGR